MVGPAYALRHALGTARGLKSFFTDLFAAFGGTSAVLQFIGQWFPGALPHPGALTVAALGVCLIWAAVRAYPNSTVRHTYRNPDMTVVVTVGDLFDQDTHLVVGFSDTFDTATGQDAIVSPASVQGQLVSRLYGGDERSLDRELASALHETAPSSRERRTDKRRGKLKRYPLGTVAVLGARPRLVFAVAYSRMGNDQVARSSVDDLWRSLDRLWDAVQRHGQQEAVAMPLVGSGLARLDFLDHETLLRLTLLSFLARSRERRVCRELRIVLWPADLSKVNLPEAAAFLRTFESRLA